MADVREFVYKGNNVHVTINRSGAEFVGVLDIEGMKVPPGEKTCAEYQSADATFQACKRKAEALIDAAGPQPSK